MQLSSIAHLLMKRGKSSSISHKKHTFNNKSSGLINLSVSRSWLSIFLAPSSSFSTPGPLWKSCRRWKNHFYCHIITFWFMEFQDTFRIQTQLQSVTRWIWETWETLRANERLWEPLRTSESIWEHLRAFESLWESLRVFESLWESLRPSGILWKILWTSEIIRTALENLWEPLIYFKTQNLLESLRTSNNLWVPLRAPEFLWDPLRDFGNLWEPLENLWDLLRIF